MPHSMYSRHITYKEKDTLSNECSRVAIAPMQLQGHLSICINLLSFQ